MTDPTSEYRDNRPDVSDTDDLRDELLTKVRTHQFFVMARAQGRLFRPPVEDVESLITDVILMAVDIAKLKIEPNVSKPIITETFASSLQNGEIAALRLANSDALEKIKSLEHGCRHLRTELERAYSIDWVQGWQLDSIAALLHLHRKDTETDLNIRERIIMRRKSIAFNCGSELS